MNRIASNIIKSLLVASVFSISGNDVEDTNDYMYTVGNNDDEQAVTSKKKSVIKNIIKLNGNGKFTLIAGHRSHYSHLSHYSGRRSRCTSFRSPMEMVLGDRAILKGMYGADIDMLAAILDSKGLYDKQHVTKIKGMTCFDLRMEQCIRNIQAKYGMTVDGVCTREVLSKIL